MKVRIKNSSGKSLEYKTIGACAFDFELAETTTIEAGEWKLLETGTVIETPEGHVLMISPRSSTFKNYGLMQVNSVGIIDNDYSGDTDTIKFPYLNMRKEAVTIQKGERIGQGTFVKIDRADFELVESTGNQDRGGFGTTGKH